MFKSMFKSSSLVEKTELILEELRQHKLDLQMQLVDIQTAIDAVSQKEAIYIKELNKLHYIGESKIDGIENTEVVSSSNSSCGTSIV